MNDRSHARTYSRLRALALALTVGLGCLAGAPRGAAAAEGKLVGLELRRAGQDHRLIFVHVFRTDFNIFSM